MNENSPDFLLGQIQATTTEINSKVDRLFTKQDSLEGRVAALEQAYASTSWLRQIADRVLWAVLAAGATAVGLGKLTV